MARRSYSISWRASPLRVELGAEGYWAKGVLAAEVQPGGMAFRIPYGASAREKQDAIEKATSEMVERVVWFITWRDLLSSGVAIGTYSTEGWAAHPVRAAAKHNAAGELVERRVFPMLVSTIAACMLRLGEFSTPLVYDSASLPDLSESVELAITIPFYIPALDLYLAYTIARVTGRPREAGGVTFGMGHARRLSEAIDASRFECALVVRTLERRLRDGVRPTASPRNLALHDVNYFEGLYRDQRLLQGLTVIKERAPRYAGEVPVLDWRSPVEMIDLSGVQPPWLLPYNRKVYFADELGGKLIPRLRELYCLST